VKSWLSDEVVNGLSNVEDEAEKSNEQRALEKNFNEIFKKFPNFSTFSTCVLQGPQQQ